ncbi:hypothetical protein M3E13_02945 [Oceanobacillus kimchii]|uniref:hypothetical protein n=1 Tax=Oceanobacillus TaxID=182709 RepID=UPI00034A219B|nr:hypothetical protein [Oceanobacillus kimchii]MCT1576793.1 hypothetical protein [Oceanobacillus kimchii]MCT2134863.1 hypothetical protein [Oceanobacillus kimchii]
MNSWLNVFLPTDEYKKQRVLYFLAEGGSVLALYLILMLIFMEFVTIIEWNSLLILWIGLIIFFFYVFARYTLSGIEYTDIMTASQLNKSKRGLRKKSIFFGTFMIIGLYITHLIGLQNGDWYDPLGVGILAGFFMYIFELTSLKRSYRKNKDLID